jgi:coenzyme F420-reducing hydrogenase gamma subunit
MSDSDSTPVVTPATDPMAMSPGRSRIGSGGPKANPTLAVWKFASCDGCQLSLLDCEDELLAVAGAVDIAFFPEATSRMVEGPYDVSLVEGSVTTAHDVERIHTIREQSEVLITIGACATAGGIQALRNGRDIEDFVQTVYARPDFISTLELSTPIAHHVPVDFELQGCPIDRGQLIEVISAHLAGRPPRIPTTSVCTQCKARGTACVMVAHGTPCLGPVTMAGCNALCPAYNRGCYGCFGPMESPNTDSLSSWFVQLGMDNLDIERVFRSYNGWTQGFRDAADAAVSLGPTRNRRS